MPPTQRETLAWFGMILGALQQPGSEKSRAKSAPHLFTSSTDARVAARAAHAGACTLSTGPGRGNRRGRALGPGAGGKHERE